MNDRRLQLVCCYSCWGCLVLFGLGWVVLAGFLPPPSPAATAAQVAHQFRGNTTGIRIGMILSILGSALLLPWGGAVAAQMRRIDSRGGALVWAWIAAQGAILIEFIYPCAFWCVAAFRLGDPTRIQSFNDLAWLPFFGIVATGMFQMVALAALTLLDKRPEPVFPRWFAYFQLWCVAGVAPAEFVFVFKTGPLAWNGLLSYWVALTAAFAWLAVTTIMTARAIKRTPDNEDLVSADGVGELRERLSAIEAELADSRLTGASAPATL